MSGAAERVLNADPSDLSGSVLTEFTRGYLIIDSANTGGDVGLETTHTSITALQGCIYNREDLADQFDLDSSPELTSASVLTAVYERKGLDGLACINGDFSFALWDDLSQQLLLGRDSTGIYPLNYQRYSSALVFASDIRLLLSLPRRTVDINELYIARYIVGISDSRASPYKAVEVVAPGQVILFRSDTLTKVNCWQLKPIGVRSSKGNEYAAELFSLLSRSIADRTDSGSHIVAELSGGLDSSSITCVANRLIAAGKVKPRELVTISVVHRRARESDETDFIREVEERIKGDHRHIVFDDIALTEGFDLDHWYDLPAPIRCYGALNNMVGEIVHSSGSCALLSGHGGDHVLWGELPGPLDVADCLWRHEYGAARSRSRVWSSATGTISWAILLKAAGLLWFGLERPFSPGANWINPAFEKRLGAETINSAPSMATASQWDLPSQRAQMRSIQRALDMVAVGAVAYYPATGPPVRPRFPFLDRNLIQYALSIPMLEVSRVEQPRSLLRNSMSGLLPVATRERKGKASPSQGLHYLLRDAWPRVANLLRTAECVRMGFIDERRLQAASNNSYHGVLDVGKTVYILALELWLRSVLRVRPPTSHAMVRLVELSRL
jgi:asparagine synthase (glutamine-hydrolysing)